MKRTALAAILAAFAPLAFGQADETGALPTRTPDRSTTCTLDSNDDTCSVALEGRQGASLQVTTANLNATVFPEVSRDGGTTWTFAYFMDPYAFDWSDFKAFSGGAATEVRTIVVPGGVSHVRVRVNPYTSGTATAVMRASETGQSFSYVLPLPIHASFPYTTAGLAADGAAVSGNPVRIAGKNGSTTQDILTDSAGNITAKVTDGTDTANVSAGGKLEVTCDNCGAPPTFEDNDAFTFNTTAISNIGFVVDDTSTNTVAENSAGAVRMNTNRILYSMSTNSTGTQVGTTSNPFGVAGAAADGAAVSGNPVLIAGQDGTNAQSIKTDSTGSVQVDIESSVSLTVGTFPDNEPFNLSQWGGATVTGASTMGDGEVGSSVTPPVGAFMMIRNSGTDNWDRLLEAINGLNSTGTGIPTAQIVGQFDDTSPTSITENQFGNLRMSANRNAFTTIRDAAGNERGANVNANNAILAALSQTSTDNDVDVASEIPGTGATNLGKAEDAGHTTADTGVAVWGVRNDADGSPTEFQGSDTEYGPIAVDSFGTVAGSLYMPWQWSYHEDSSSALTDTTVHASCGTGLFNYIDTLVFSTGAATAASIKIEDSTTTTILGPYYLEAVNGRGMAINFMPGKKQTTSATLISVTTTGAIAHSIDIVGHCGR